MQVVWNAYVEAMSRAKFDSDTPLYVASALLTYNARGGTVGQHCVGVHNQTFQPDHLCYTTPPPSDLLKIVGKLKADGFCNEVHFKEMYIPKKELQGVLQ